MAEGAEGVGCRGYYASGDRHDGLYGGCWANLLLDAALQSARTGKVPIFWAAGLFTHNEASVTFHITNHSQNQSKSYTSTMTESTMDIDTPSAETKAPQKKNVTPSASAESASLHPSMSLAQSIHRLTMLHTGKLSAEDAKQLFDPEALLKDVMKTVLAGDKSVSEAVQENEKRIQQLVDGDIKSIDDDEGPLLNVSLYNHLASTLSQPPLSESDSALLESHHKSSLESLSGLITKAQEEMGDMEVLAAKLTVARYSTKCLDKKQAMDAYEQVIASPKLSTGKKLDAYLEMGRVASFYGDVPAFTDILDKATKVIARGGDWDRRNRLKAYKATSQILIRDLESASKLLVEGIATFSCTELCDYAEFVVYAVVLGVMYLPRVELKKSIIDGSEILTVAKDIPVVVCCLV